MSEKYKETNLENEVKAARSHYKTYQQVVNIKSNLSSANIIRIDESDPDVLQITRKFDDEDVEYSLVFNMGEDIKSVPIQQGVSGIYEVLSSSVNASYVPG